MSQSWRPTATFAVLRRRAAVLAQIRGFFAERQVLEVETPSLAAGAATAPHLDSFYTYYQSSDRKSQKLYLQTSPEFAMKRLLAAGSGPIYQITRAFRNCGEQGQWHNPEFTLLEWYRPDFTLTQLMDETETLLMLILGCPAAIRLSYVQLFEHYVHLDPHTASLAEIKNTLQHLSIHLQPSDWLTHREAGLQIILDYLVKHYVEPNHLLFLYDFPATQAALARIRPGSPPIAERVEVYLEGLELANGFHELANPVEQKSRFIQELANRKAQNLPQVPIDHYLIEALTHGFPDCSGIALGIDRLVALATKSATIQSVITFPIDRA
jgi:elongation factor P--(R)-beta-lysine ligase